MLQISHVVHMIIDVSVSIIYVFLYLDSNAITSLKFAALICEILFSTLVLSLIVVGS